MPLDDYTDAFLVFEQLWVIDAETDYTLVVLRSSGNVSLVYEVVP